ncbi:site-specific DNA-methyltransferase [Campylobacter sp. RM5004]|uniref:site-specific DNA-methyltransferase n=1 Tax=Campylobacter sp. RM5004 TaxID=1660078 RepID=UPI001EFB9C4A|nr:site-specific DNA-methyltransferase [Campylobacter sp. RM5004]
MIYIDPPYNTANGDFVYNDTRTYKLDDLINAGMSEDEAKRVLEFSTKKSSSHSAWLTFMYPRLFLARKLLKDDGVIFISIDDNETAQLKLLCDEIFGEENFVAQLSVVDNLKGNNNTDGIVSTNEYCLVYTKNYQFAKFYDLYVDKTDDDFSEWQKDEKGYWKKGRNIKGTGENAPREKRPTMFYPIYLSNSLEISTVKSNYYNIEVLPITNGQEMCWNWSKDTVEINKDELIVEKSKNGYNFYKKQRPSLSDLPTRKIKTTCYKPSYSTSASANTMKELFDNKVIFNYTKSVDLIKDFMQISTDKDDIVLDFFAGSGTTGHAVMQLNAEDGGNRKYILVQLDEKIDEKKNKIAYDFVKDELKREPTIYEITRERLLRAGKKISHDYANATNLEFSEFSIVPKDELELEKLEKLDLSLSDDLFINFDDSKTNEILTSYKLADGIALDVEFKTVFLNEYKAYYSNKLLYLVYPYFTSENTKALMQKLQNKDLICERVILYNASFKSSEHKTLKDALNQIGVKLQVRF